MRFSGRLKVVLDLILNKDYINLWKITYKILGTKPERKTVVFSIKMAYYGLRALYELVPQLPMEIPIPVDVRIAKITYKAGLIEGAKDWQELYRKPTIVINLWNIVANRTGIPPLHLDSLLWMLCNEGVRKYISKIIGHETLMKLIKILRI